MILTAVSVFGLCFMADVACEASISVGFCAFFAFRPRGYWNESKINGGGGRGKERETVCLLPSLPLPPRSFAIVPVSTRSNSNKRTKPDRNACYTGYSLSGNRDGFWCKISSTSAFVWVFVTNIDNTWCSCAYYSAGGPLSTLFIIYSNLD